MHATQINIATNYTHIESYIYYAVNKNQ